MATDPSHRRIAWEQRQGSAESWSSAAPPGIPDPPPAPNLPLTWQLPPLLRAWSSSGLQSPWGPPVTGRAFSIEAGVLPAVAVRVIPDGASVSGVGGTTVFRPEALDAEGRKIPSPGASWSSLNPKVATVDDQGVAIALLSGQATITAEVDGVVGSGVLTVSVPDAEPVTSRTTAWRGPVLEGV